MKKFYLFITMFVLFSFVFVAQAQKGLYYNDLSPDRLLQRGNSFDVVLLHPSFPSDYIIREDFPDTSSITNFRIRIFPGYDYNEVLCSNDSLVKALKTGDSISDNQTIWTNNSVNWMVLCNVGTNNYGAWQNVPNKFIGLRMYKNGDYYYGYVQMSVSPQTGGQPTTTIYDLAYQEQAGKGLKAGQTVGVKHITLNQAKYFLYGRELHILTDKAEKLSITDISGHQLLNKDVRSDKSFDLSGYPYGIYLLKITTPNGILTDKILLR